MSFVFFIFFLFQSVVAAQTEKSRRLTSGLDARRLLYLQNYLLISSTPNPSAEKELAADLQGALDRFLRAYMRSADDQDARLMFSNLKEAIEYYKHNRGLQRGRRNYLNSDLLRNLPPFSPKVKRRPSVTKGLSQTSMPEERSVSLPAGDEESFKSIIEDPTTIASGAAGQDWKSSSPSDAKTSLSSMSDAASMMPVSGESLSTLLALAPHALSSDEIDSLKSVSTSSGGSEGTASKLGDSIPSSAGPDEGAAGTTKSGDVQGAQRERTDEEKRLHSEIVRGKLRLLALKLQEKRLKDAAESGMSEVSSASAAASFDENLIFSEAQRQKLFSGRAPDTAMFMLTDEDKKHRMAVLSVTEKESSYDADNPGHILLRDKLYAAYLFSHALALAGKGSAALNGAVRRMKGASFSQSLSECYSLLDKRTLGPKELAVFWTPPKVDIKLAADNDGHVSAIKAQVPLLIKTVEGDAERGMILPYPSHVLERFVRIINVNAGMKQTTLWSELDEALLHKDLSQKVKDWAEKSGVELRAGVGRKIVEVARGVHKSSTAERSKGIFACLALADLWYDGHFSLVAVKLDGRSRKGSGAVERAKRFAGLEVMMQKHKEGAVLDTSEIRKSLLTSREILSWFVVHTAWAMSFEAGHINLRGFDPVSSIVALAKGMLSLEGRSAAPDSMNEINLVLSEYAERLASLWGVNTLQGLLCMM